jgi:hypothetical protein
MSRRNKPGSVFIRRCIFAGIILLFACCWSDAPPLPRSAAMRAARLWAHVDPQTGEFGAPSTDEALSDAEGSGGALPPLEVVRGRTAAGGVMVDLRGHFTYGLRASVTTDGRLAAHCVEPEVATGE